MPMPMPMPTTFAIIGAGPAGLGAARAFMNQGLDVELLERHDLPGGIWNMDNPGTPMYSSCNFISSRDYGAFIGHKMPENYPLYPRWDQIRDYIHSFADAYGIREKIRFGAEVMSAVPTDGEEGRYWTVTLEDGTSKDYRGVVIASGAQWKPYLPDFPGLEGFTGTALHSSKYADPEQFLGKRVLVVGAGNSGVDIAADAAHFGSDATLSTRRAYWFLPKVLFGEPVPDILGGNVVPEPGSPLYGKTFEEHVKMILESVGDLRLYGLPTPDHQLGQSHPIMNNEALHCMAHGMLHWKPNITSVQGSEVTFEDGSTQTVDVIVFATGYDATTAYLPEGILDYQAGHPRTRLGALIDGQEGLYMAGALHFAGHTFPVFEQCAQLAAHDAKALVTGENAENLRRLREEFHPDLTGGFPFLDSRRNTNQVHLPALNEAFETLERDYGIAVPKLGNKVYAANLRRQLLSS